MAVNAYIQSAITQLHSALDHMHQEIDGMQRQATQEKQHLQQDIQHLEQTARADESAISQQQADAERQMLSARARQSRHEVDERKVRLSHIDTELQHALQSKTQVYNRLQDLTHQLDMLLALPDVH